MFPKIRELSKNITVYGLGDVAVSLVNFALLGLYVKYFDAADYGVIGMLGRPRGARQDRLPVRARRLVHAAVLRRRPARGAAAAREHDLLLPARARTARWSLALLLAAPALSRVAARRPGLCAARAADAREHVRDRIHVHPVPRAAHGTEVGDLQR